MSKILIVGGAGYIGGALTDLLMSEDAEVTVYDSLLFQPYFLKMGFEFVRGDIRDSDKLKSYLDKADIVVWLAAHVGDGACSVDPAISLEINRERVEWLSRNFDGKIFYTSTCSVYGMMDGLLTEDSPTNPISLYAKSKLESEKYLQGKGICYRLGTLYGVGDDYSRLRFDLVANKMTADAYYQQEVSVYGGEQFRPCLHVKDVAWQIKEDILRDDGVTGVYNLADQNLTISQIAEVVNQVVPTAIKITDIPTEDLRNYSVCCRKAKSELNFSPRFSLLEGVQEIAWLIRTGRIVNAYDPLYHNHNFFKKEAPHLDNAFPALGGLVAELKGTTITSVL